MAKSSPAYAVVYILNHPFSSMRETLVQLMNLQTRVETLEQIARDQVAQLDNLVKERESEINALAWTSYNAIAAAFQFVDAIAKDSN